MDPLNIPPQQPTEPIVSKPHRLFVLSLVIGGAVILLAGLIGGFYLAKKQSTLPLVVKTIPTVTPSLSPTPVTQDETANWKTYSNTQYGFSFKHPNLDDLTNTIGIAGPQDTTNNLKPVVEFADKTTIKMPNTDAAFDGFAIYVVSNSQKYTLSQYIELQKKSLTIMSEEFQGSSYVDQTQQLSLSVGNQQAVLLTNTGDHVDRVYIGFPDNSQFLVIGKIQSNNRFNDTFNQILSTFKFTPSSNSLQSINLPVTVLKTSYGIVGQSGQPPTYNYPVSIDVSVPVQFVNQISAYGVGEKVIIGPINWTGDGQIGADGTATVSLYPTGGTPITGPHITFGEITGCQSCMQGEAALYFPAAKIQYEKNFPGPLTIPAGLVVKPVSSTLVKYSLPNTKDGMVVNGVAFYGGSPYPHFSSMEVALQPNQPDLSDFILTTFISRENLQ